VSALSTVDGRLCAYHGGNGLVMDGFTCTVEPEDRDEMDDEYGA